MNVSIIGTYRERLSAALGSFWPRDGATNVGRGVATYVDTAGPAHRKLRVLYFTVIPMGTAASGGSICCRNHVARLAADPDIELTAAVASPADTKRDSEDFFVGLGVSNYFIPLRQNNIYHSKNSIFSIAQFIQKTVFQFYWELRAMNQPHVQECIDSVISRCHIDVLLIEYHPSAYFIDLPRDDVRTVIIKQNREGDFYADLIRLGKTQHGSLTAWLSLWRARRFERKIDANVDQVITIGPPDLPTGRLSNRPICISPYLDARPKRWRYARTNRLFFVGDVGHYPNELALKWIAEQLAPALTMEGSAAHVMIVGAVAHRVPLEWNLPNITFLGRATDDEVSALFLTSDLMLCPIKNDYGVKFKSLEALSYGIPLLASEEALRGLPYLKSEPRIDLNDAKQSAQTICSLLAHPHLLQALSENQAAQQRAFVASQQSMWSRTLSNIPSKKYRTRRRQELISQSR